MQPFWTASIDPSRNSSIMLLLLRFTQEFYGDGVINWQKIVAFTSKKNAKTVNPTKTTKAKRKQTNAKRKQALC
ncbi:hypothetical protein [Rhodoflexus sp.]